MVRRLVESIRPYIIWGLLLVLAAGPMMTACGSDPITGPKATEPGPDQNPDDGGQQN